MPFSGPLDDRLAITELTATYGHCISSRDMDRLLSLWAEDGRWFHPAYGWMEGHAEIRKTCSFALSRLSMLFFIGSLGELTITGDTAAGEFWPYEVAVRDGKTEILCGHYTDEYVNRDGRWLFKQRQYRLVHKAGT